MNTRHNRKALATRKKIDYRNLPQETIYLAFPGLNNPIDVKLIYLPNPVAIQAAPLTLHRALTYILFRTHPLQGFLIRQAGVKYFGKGQTTITSRFIELYSAAPWINEEAKLELDAIQEAFRQRKTRISEHLGIEFII